MVPARKPCTDQAPPFRLFHHLRSNFDQRLLPFFPSSLRLSLRRFMHSWTTGQEAYPLVSKHEFGTYPGQSDLEPSNLISLCFYWQDGRAVKACDSSVACLRSRVSHHRMVAWVQVPLLSTFCVANTLMFCCAYDRYRIVFNQ